MTRAMIAPLIFGIAGTAVLIALGVWQMQRLAWKEAVLAEIETRIEAAPVAVPEAPDRTADRYLPVQAEGVFAPEYVRVLVSAKGVGAAYRIVSPLVMADGRRVLVDRGLLPVAQERPDSPEGPARVTGNLHWPEEIDGFTPDPDHSANIWFARNVDQLASFFDTSPVLIVARSEDPGRLGLTPRPVGSEGIPNDHLEYAITWFLLALVWAGMTGFLLWRIRRRTV